MDGRVNLHGPGVMDGSVNQKGSGVMDGSVYLFTRAPACSTTARIFYWFICLLQNNESRKQQLTTKQRKHETTKARYNQSTKQRKHDTTKLRNSETAKQRNINAELRKGDANWKTTKLRNNKVRNYERAMRKCEDSNSDTARWPYPDTINDRLTILTII